MLEEWVEKMSAGRNLERIALLLLIIFATGLRLYHLDWQSLWDDEGFTAALLERDLWRIWAETPLGNLPLHYYIVGAWAAVAGISEFSLRYVSLWFGVLLVPLSYHLSGKLFGPSARLPAALLMAMAPPFIYHSQSARPYTLLTALYLANFLFVLRLLGQPGSWWLWLGLTITTVLSSYTHFFGMVLPLLAILLFLPLARKDRRFLYGLAASTAGTMLLFSPWLVAQLGANAGYAHGYLSVAPGAIGSMALAHAEQTWVGLMAQISYDFSVEATHVWTLLPLAASCGGLILLWRRQVSSVWLAVVIYLFAAVAIGLVISTFFTFFNPRYLLYVAPLCYALIAGLASWRWPNNRPIALVVICALLLLWIPVTATYYQNSAHENLRSLARRIISERQPNDAIVVNSGWRDTLLDYYLRDADGPPRYIIPLEATPHEKATREGLRQVVARHQRVWEVFFGAPPTSATNAIGSVLSERFARVGNQWYGTTRLGLYVKSKTANEGAESTTSETKADTSIIFESDTSEPSRSAGELRLTAGPLQWPPNGRPLDSIVIPLDWSPLRPLTKNYAASLRLVDNEGIVWSQADSAPRNGYLQTEGKTPDDSWREYRGLVVPVGTPPGYYTVTMLIYDRATGQPLKPVGERRLGRVRSLALGQIQVHEGDRQPDLTAFPSIVRHNTVFAQQLMLLGSKWDKWQEAGRQMSLQLYWQPLKPMDKDYHVRIRLEDRWGRVTGELTRPLSRADYPTSRWTTKSAVKGQYRLLLDRQSEPGEYALHVSVIDPQSGTLLATKAGTAPVAGFVEVKAPPSPEHMPPMEKLVDATFGSGLTLLGYTITNTAGETKSADSAASTRRVAKVVLYWRWRPIPGTNEAVIDRSYTSFVHLLNSKGVLVSQHDGIPGNGRLPTTTWGPDEVIADPHLVAKPADTQEEPFTLIAGLYDSETVERLATSEGADHVRLEELTSD